MQYSACSFVRFCHMTRNASLYTVSQRCLLLQVICWDAGVRLPALNNFRHSFNLAAASRSAKFTAICICYCITTLPLALYIRLTYHAWLATKLPKYLSVIFHYSSTVWNDTTLSPHCRNFKPIHTYQCCPPSDCDIISVLIFFWSYPQIGYIPYQTKQRNASTICGNNTTNNNVQLNTQYNDQSTVLVLTTTRKKKTKHTQHKRQKWLNTHNSDNLCSYSPYCSDVVHWICILLYELWCSGVLIYLSPFHWTMTVHCTTVHTAIYKFQYFQPSSTGANKYTREQLTAKSSLAVMYGLSPVVRARNAASTSRADWTFSVSRLIINAMYSCSETKPSLYTDGQRQVKFNRSSTNSINISENLKLPNTLQF